MKNLIPIICIGFLLTAEPVVSAEKSDHAGSVVLLAPQMHAWMADVLLHFSNKYHAKTSSVAGLDLSGSSPDEIKKNLGGKPALLVILNISKESSALTSKVDNKRQAIIVDIPAKQFAKPNKTVLLRSISRSLSTLADNKLCPNILCANAKPDLHKEVGKHYIDLCPPCDAIVQKRLLENGMQYRAKLPSSAK